MNQVRDQHIERCHKFLCEELQSSTSEYLHNRVFFTSGREMLKWKISSSHYTPQPSIQFMRRKSEFEKFESMLKHHLTSSSIHTKYGTHTMTAKNICFHLMSGLDAKLDSLEEKEKHLEKEKEKLVKVIEETNYEMELLATDLKEEILFLLESICPIID